MHRRKSMDIEVESIYNGFPDDFKIPLLQIRELIYKISDGISQVREIEESIKWGQLKLDFLN